MDSDREQIKQNHIYLTQNNIPTKLPNSNLKSLRRQTIQLILEFPSLLVIIFHKENDTHIAFSIKKFRKKPIKEESI